jgi:hypothetical protein
MLAGGEGMVPCLIPLFFAYYLAIFYRYHQVIRCAAEMLADGSSVFTYSSNLH